MMASSTGSDAGSGGALVSRGAAAATERSRYGGPDEPLRKIYAKHCKLRGPSFITYNEAETVSSSKLDKEMVRKHHELLSDINALTDKLALKRKQNERCLLEVGKASVDRWKFDSTMLSGWVSCMDTRVRNLCRKVMDGQRRQPAPRWVSELPWAKGAIAASDATLGQVAPATPRVVGKKKPAPTEKQYLYGWDAEVARHFRCTKIGSPPELAKPPSLVEGAPDSNFVVAEWEDGHAKTMHNMTIGQLRLQLEGRAARDSEGPLWTGEMADGSFNAVTVRQRSDRQVLLSVYVQGRQIHNVAIGRFGTLEPPQPRIMPGGTPAVQRALKFMLPHVQRYTSGEYDSVAALKAAVREDLKSIPKLPPPPRVGWKVNRVVGVGAPDEDKRDAPTQRISKKTRLVKQPTVDSVPELEAELEAELAPKLFFPEPSKCTWDSLL